jgi:hypothetical protein
MSLLLLLLTAMVLAMPITVNWPFFENDCFRD